MRTRISIAASSLLAGALLLGAVDCTNQSEGLNIHNLHVTVLVPKTVVTSASGVGVVYVGVWSGVDSRLGFPSPVVYPNPNPALQDSFPFGGASIGDFETRDFRLECKTVSNQTVVDAGANWKLEGDVLQFPFYKGEVVWAFADRFSTPFFDYGTHDPAVESEKIGSAFTTCDTNDGFFSSIAVPIDMTAIATTGATWATTPVTRYKVTLAPTQLTYGVGGNPFFEATDTLDIRDTHGHFFNVSFALGTNGLPSTQNLLDPTANPVTLTLDPNVGAAISPEISGGTTTSILEDVSANPVSYGSQFHDILNFPAKYVTSGDLVSSGTVINDLSPVTVTLDTKVGG